jgi:hypothetical protein
MKNPKNSFLKNLRYLCLVGVIALGLMTIVGSGGGGGGGGAAAIDGGGSGGGGGGGGGTTIGEVIDTSFVTFSVSNAVSLVATENIGSQSARRSVRKDGKTIPTYVFRKFMTEEEAKARSATAQRQDEEIGCNLLSIDENGVASDALESIEELNVMYTVLSKDGKKVFVVLDPDYIWDTQNTVGATNCMLFAVDLETNEYTCLDQGYAAQKMDNDFRQTISSGTAKPIQMDEDGNIYYLGRPYTVNSNTWCEQWDQFGNCVNEHTDYWLDMDWSVQPVIRKISVQKDEDDMPLYDEDGNLLYDEPESLTPDNNYIGSFLVSKDGILVYTYENQETGDGGIKMYADGSTNELTDDTTGWWGDMFYVIGDSGTVIYGSGSASWGNEGVKFAQRHPVVPGAKVVCKLDTSLFTARNNSPTPSRIILGDDGYIYGIFNEDTSYWDESQGTQVSQARINLFRILPYKQVPIFSVKVLGDWWNAMRGFDVQISKGYSYHVQSDKHSQGLYSDRNVIVLTKLATGEQTILLNGSHVDEYGYTRWDDRYVLYSWKLVGSKIHFSGFNNNTSRVITGEIDITRLRQGYPATGDNGYLTINDAASALGESARIRDMEIVRPEVVYDPVGAPVITKIYTDPENRYSASIDFSKYMNRSDVNSKLSITDVATDDEVAFTMKVWSYRTLHLIFDSNATNATTDPLFANTMYQIAVDGTAWDLANEWSLDMVEDPLLSTTWKTVPDQGWYQSQAIALEGYSDSSVGKYVKAENTDTHLDFYRLLGTKDDQGNWTGTQKKNFKLELAIQYLGDSWHHWNGITLRLNDAKMIDWSNVDWSLTKITDPADPAGYEWRWVDGHRTDGVNKYYWCNIDVCEEGVEGIYDQDNTVYEWHEGHDVDVYGNTYYWFWDDDTESWGYYKYDENGEDGGNLLATINWVDGYYTDENGVIYRWSFGEYRDVNDDDNIVEQGSGHTYTWHEGYYEDGNGNTVEMPALEWENGQYVADGGTAISDWEYWDMDWVDGYYQQYDDADNPTDQTTSYWQSGWQENVDVEQMVENDVMDNWEARLWRLEFGSAGFINGEYHTGEWEQTGINVESTSNQEARREWRKIVISVYGSNLDVAVIDENGDTITSIEKTDYVNTSGPDSGYYFLDLNVYSNSVMLDNVVITELDENENEIAGDPLLQETFTSSSFDTNVFAAAGTYSSDW